MAKENTVTVNCPDGIERQAQVYSTGIASVRVGGRRFQGTVDAVGTFTPTGMGKNGNCFRYLTA